MNNLMEIQAKLQNNFFRQLLSSNQILKTIYRERMNQAARSNAYKTSENYRTLHANVQRQLANAMKSENRPNIRYRKQQGDTCWFHSIVNGLLLSAHPRAILKQMSEHVPEDNRTRNFNLCPLRTASNLLFWRYIKHRLDGYGGVSAAFKNTNVIKSANFRGFDYRLRIFLKKGLRAAMARNKYDAGTKYDMFNFYRKMFPRGLFIMKECDEGPIPHSLPGGYILTHADVSVWTAPANPNTNAIIYGHAIAGYITPGGKYKMYDSASDKVIDYDWTRPTKTYWDDNIILVKTIAVYTNIK